MKMTRPAASHNLIYSAIVCIVAGAMILSCGDHEAPIGEEDIKKKKAALVGFNPIQCPANNPQVYPVKISTEFWQQLKMYQPSTYANHTYRPWRMLFNQNVWVASLRFTGFETENNYDKLYIMHGLGTTEYHGRDSQSDPNVPPLNTFIPFLTNFSGTAPAYLDYKWHSDSSINYQGNEIDALQLHCAINPQPPSNTLYVARNYPHEGYLLGSTDVIYVKVVQPAGYEMGLVLWPLTNNVDFDLYASTSSSFPNNSDFMWSGVNYGQTPELVIIPSWGSVGQGYRDVFITIHSYSGMGHFRFYANIHGEAAAPMNAGTDWNPNAADKDYIKRILKKTSIAAYMATEGRYLIKNWYLHWNDADEHLVRFEYNNVMPSGGNGVCKRKWDDYHSNPGSTCWSDEGHHIELDTQTWCGTYFPNVFGCSTTSDQKAEDIGANLLLHELGHCLPEFRLRDEYMATHNCGHSIMSNAGYSSNITDFCMLYNGGHDSTNGHSSAENNWACIAPKIYGTKPVDPPVPTLHTPDAFYRVEGTITGISGQYFDDSVVTVHEIQH